MWLTAKERTIKKPESTEDVPRGKQIVRMGNKWPMLWGYTTSVKKPIVKRANDIDSGLMAEAKKYKSAEDFMKAQWVPLYHWTDAKFDKFDIGKSWEKWISLWKWINLAEKKWEAEFYSKNKNTIKVFLDKNINIKSFDSQSDFIQQRKNSWFNSSDNSVKWINDDIAKYSKYLLEKWYDWIMIPVNNNYRMRAWWNAEFGRNLTIFNPEKVKTESQLRKIYEQANKK
jgi:hypothetical protein